jgi:hypothetical protein
MPRDEESGPAITPQSDTHIDSAERDATSTRGPRAILGDLPELDPLWIVLALGFEVFLAFVQLGFAVVHEKSPSWYIAFVLYVIPSCYQRT